MARDNPVQRMEEQQQDLLHRRQLRSDPEYQAHELQLNNMRRQQVCGNRQATFRATIIHTTYLIIIDDNYLILDNDDNT